MTKTQPATAASPIAATILASMAVTQTTKASAAARTAPRLANAQTLLYLIARPKHQALTTAQALATTGHAPTKLKHYPAAMYQSHTAARITTPEQLAVHPIVASSKAQTSIACLTRDSKNASIAKGSALK